MNDKKVKLNAVLGGYFTGNLPESAAICAFAVDKTEEGKSAGFDNNTDENGDSSDFYFDEQ